MKVLRSILLLFALAAVVAVLSAPAAAEEADENQQQASSEAPKGPVVLGMDLSQAPVTRDIGKLPDLWQLDPEQPGKWKSTPGVFPMPLDEHAWLQYAVAKGRWYIEYRDDRDKPETERVYGPFEGDPFETFRLEEKMAAKMADDAHAGDDLYRIKLMLRNGDRHLMARAFRLMNVALGDDVPPQVRANYLPQFRKHLEEFAEQIAAQPAAIEDASKLAARLDVVAKLIDDLTLEFPREEYSGPKPDVMATVPADAWGDVVNGLRFAAAPESRNVRLGEAIKVHLVVENVSDRDIKFSAIDLMQSPRAEMLGKDGEAIPLSQSWFSGLAPIERFWLRPKERIVLASPTVKFASAAEDIAVFGQSLAVVGAGEHRLRYTMHLSGGSAWVRQDDGVMRRTLPAKGEWEGMLTSAYLSLTVAE